MASGTDALQESWEGGVDLDRRGIIVDAHVHVLPDPLGAILDRTSNLTGVDGQVLVGVKSRVRSVFRPVSHLVHRAYSGLRHFPFGVRLGVEELGSFLPGAGLMVESSASDLLESMDRNQITSAILIAHPPVTSNERVLELAREHSDRIIPAVNYGRGCGLTDEEAQTAFRRAIDQREGALLLKIHAASDGDDAESQRYRALLDIASDFSVPVILHTGCIQAHLIHRSPSLGEPSRFRSWFADWPRLPFILAHMNMHDPGSALDLGEEFSNIYLDTSWQPAEVVVEAVRRVGSGRVFFGSDWPLIGNNQAVALGRIDQALASGYITQEDAAGIRGENLANLLKASFTEARARVLEARTKGEN